MNNSTLRAIFFLAALLTFRLCSGQTAGAEIQNPKSKVGEKLTITQAVEIAVANHPALRSARERAAAAQARVGVAKSKFFPQVTFNGVAKLGLSGATNGLGLLGLPASPLYRNLSDAVNVNQNIFDFGLTRHATSVARYEAEAAQQDVAEVRIRVAERAKQTFLRVLGAQQAIKVREQALRERQEVLRKVDEFSQAGLSSKLDVKLAEAGRSTGELALSQARHAEQIALAELFAAIGQAEGEHYDLLEPEFRPVSPGELEDEIKQALVNRPDLKSFEAEIEAQRQRVEYAHSLGRPVLKGVWSGGYARFAELTASRLMVGGLGLIAPLYTGGELKARVQEEEGNLETLRAQYSSRLLEVRTEVSRAHVELLNALESAAANQKISEYAEAALRLAGTRYHAQLASFVELTTAETTTEQARTDYVQALYGFQIARAHLDAAMGLQP